MRTGGKVTPLKPILTALCLILAPGLATIARADDYQSVRVTKILTSTTAADGRKLGYLRTENPEVTALLVEIPPGGETGWHLHAVPVYAYMLAGSITVEMKDGKKYEYKEGEAIFDVMNSARNGRNTGDRPARLVVFYTGEAGKASPT
jgi:quercetin dioxygenase-like cupin family protein